MYSYGCIYYEKPIAGEFVKLIKYYLSKKVGNIFKYIKNKYLAFIGTQTRPQCGSLA